MRQFQHTVGFFVVKRALRASQHRIVISQNRSTCLIFRKLITIDCAETGNQTVGWGVVDQVVKFAPLTLGSNNQLAVFDKTVGIT